MGEKEAECVTIGSGLYDQLKALHASYKLEIGEDEPSQADLDKLCKAIGEGRITFYGCMEGERLVACCSVTETFSTFNYARGGVFEDFYILPEFRHQGIARRLVEYAWTASGVASLTVGCADCDLKMYNALGFSIPLGHLLAYDG